MLTLLEIVIYGAVQSSVYALLAIGYALKRQDDAGLSDVDRAGLYRVQTPQVFRYEDIFLAHQRAHQEGWEEVPDDALLLEKLGVRVRVIEGSEDNIKVTTPHDLALAEFFLLRRQAAEQGKAVQRKAAS